jgi:penicillin-binding protein 2
MKRIGFSRTARAAAARGPSVGRRAFVLMGGQLAVMGGLAWRMRQLQVEEGELYRAMAEENRVNMRLIPPARGEIRDRHGRPLAVNRQNFRVVVVREQAGDVAATLDRLARVLPISAADRERALREFAQKSAFVPVTVAEHLDWESFARVNANAPALPGVIPEVGLTRLYPDGVAVAHVTGHVGRVSQADREADGGADPLLLIPDFQIGKNGVEKLMEDVLRGQAGAQRIEVNAVGRVIREIGRDPAVSGRDLTLTLDLDLQKFAMERMGTESAATVVMDAATGDLLCLASAPGFDPNVFAVGIGREAWSALLADDHRPLANKTVSGQYPPGSTYKMLVGLAALERGAIGPRDTVFCNGGYDLGDRRFHCWKRGGHGHMNARDAIKQSCDVYFYEVARRIGIDDISAMANRFGCGVRHELPLSAIREGIAPTRAWKRAAHDQPWQAGDTLNGAIGQGFTLSTPLQLCVMTARFATGRAVEPRLIAAVGDAAPSPPVFADLGVRRAHMDLMRDAMNAVVNEERGTARSSRIYDPDNAMAGKTGTSQVRRITMAERARGVLRNDQLPWNRRDHALFVGYAPAHAPRYAIAVVVEHGGGGSSAAAPIARDVMMRALYGERPPLIAYPPADRERIRLEREPPAAEQPPAADAPRSRA